MFFSVFGQLEYLGNGYVTNLNLYRGFNEI